MRDDEGLEPGLSKGLSCRGLCFRDAVGVDHDGIPRLKRDLAHLIFGVEEQSQRRASPIEPPPAAGSEQDRKRMTRVDVAELPVGPVPLAIE